MILCSGLFRVLNRARKAETISGFAGLMPAVKPQRPSIAGSSKMSRPSGIGCDATKPLPHCVSTILYRGSLEGRLIVFESAIWWEAIEFPKRRKKSSRLIAPIAEFISRLKTLDEKLIVVPVFAVTVDEKRFFLV